MASWQRRKCVEKSNKWSFSTGESYSLGLQVTYIVVHHHVSTNTVGLTIANMSTLSQFHSWLPLIALKTKVTLHLLHRQTFRSIARLCRLHVNQNGALMQCNEWANWRWWFSNKYYGKNYLECKKDYFKPPSRRNKF